MLGNRYITRDRARNGHGGLLWNPTFLSSKNLCWLDFVDLNYITLASGKIASITDKSSNARVFSQATDANRPTYYNNGASFLRTIAYLSYTGAFIFNNSGGFRIFATVINETDSAGGDGVLISECTYNTNSRPYFIFIAKRPDSLNVRNRIGTIYINSVGGSGGLTNVSTTSNAVSISLTDFNLISMQDSVTSYKNFVNTVETASLSYTRTGTLTGTNRTVIGALINSTPAFTSTAGWLRVRDILVTSNNLTSNELDNINGYMAWNCGSQNSLPISHPYRYSPPYV